MGRPRLYATSVERKAAWRRRHGMAVRPHYPSAAAKQAAYRARQRQAAQDLAAPGACRDPAVCSGTVGGCRLASTLPHFWASLDEGPVGVKGLFSWGWLTCTIWCHISVALSMVVNVAWKWRLGAYPRRTGCSTCKFSPREGISACLNLPTTKCDGMWELEQAGKFCHRSQRHSHHPHPSQ
jgi:hypothetical protein